ncbi:hypothetical protein HC891_08880 [Candidatus Gracilibacteria bacterium]|nr:hypothetical protein [Candidatus Gracilibacteria bacterium]
MAGSYNRDQIRAALAETDPNFSNYLDLESGQVIRVNDTDGSADGEELRNAIFAGYGDRYRYIPGGNTAPGDSDIQTWLEAEGL